MRKIKFKARIIGTEEWTYGFICPGNMWYIVTQNNTHEVDIKTLCEYTGVNDKNGKEIYEGDTMLAYGKKWHILFSEGAFVAKHRWEYKALRMMYGEVIEKG